nr:MAG TPA: hypothetical protein [Caudoviricetes sp.]
MGRRDIHISCRSFFEVSAQQLLIFISKDNFTHF